MKIFALTGGIACGKSTVASLIRNYGVPVVDADALAKLAWFTNQQVIFDLFGTIDRKEVGRIVFSDADKKSQLEAVLHPQIQTLASELFETFQKNGNKLACYDIPLLFEANQQDKYNPIIVVTTTPELQLQRLMQRNPLTKEEALARINSQMKLSEKEDLADIIIENNGDIKSLKQKVALVLLELGI